MNKQNTDHTSTHNEQPIIKKTMKKEDTDPTSKKNKQSIQQEHKQSPELASRGGRFAASIIDAVIVSPIGLIIFYFLGLFDNIFNNNLTITDQIIMFVIGQALYLLLNGYLLHKYGQTIGKKLLKIQIINKNNKIPNLTYTYLLRVLLIAAIGQIPFYVGTLFSLVDILFIFRKDRRCIHDHIAKTKVIQLPQKNSNHTQQPEEIPKEK